MKDKSDFVNELAELSELIDLENFYSINLWTGSNQIACQGYQTEINRRFAKDQGITLEYDNESGILRGQNESGTLRITLT